MSKKNIQMKVLGESGYDDICPVPASHKQSHISGDDAITPADIGAVPTSRTVNGKTLSANITLSASDVGAVTMTEVNSAIQTAIGNAIGGSY